MKTSKKCMILCMIAALLLQCLFAGCGRSGAAPDDTSSTSARPGEDVSKTHTYSGFSEEAGARMSSIAERWGAVGVQLALLDGGDIKSFCYGYADLDGLRPVTENTKYRVASLSKLVVSATFMAAAEHGIVSEDSDISDYFDGGCRHPRYRDIAITPSMLMTHTSSLSEDGSYVYYDGLFSERGTFLRQKPGTAYEYSNFGYGVLSCVLERAAGRSLNALAREYLFEPLNIDAAYTYNELRDTSDVGVLYGEGGLSVETLAGFESYDLGDDMSLAAGNLIISAKDYVKILGLMIHEGHNIDGQSVLAEETVEKMLASRASAAGFDVAYGSQIQTDVIEGSTVYVHTGSAYGMFSAYVFDPATKRAVAVLTTGEDRSTADNGVYELCLDLIREIWDM